MCLNYQRYSKVIINLNAKGDVTKLFEKDNVDAPKATRKYNITHRAFVEFYKILQGCLSLWMRKNFKTLKKYLQFKLKL